MSVHREEVLASIRASHQRAIGWLEKGGMILPLDPVAETVADVLKGLDLNPYEAAGVALATISSLVGMSLSQSEDEEEAMMRYSPLLVLLSACAGVLIDQEEEA